jgi:hypothetical protein
MLVPNSKPMRQTRRAVVLRELALLSGMAVHLRTKGLRPPTDERSTHTLRPASKADAETCAGLDYAVWLATEVLQQIEESPPGFEPLSETIQNFLDVAYAAKAAFFGRLHEADDWFPC